MTYFIYSLYIVSFDETSLKANVSILSGFIILLSSLAESAILFTVVG